MSESKPSLHDRISYQAVLLGGFAALAAVFLVSGNMLTNEPIKARQKEDLLASLGQVMPPDLYDNDVLSQPLKISSGDGLVTVYRGTHEDRVSALAWEIAGQGYAGEIRLILGMKPNGEILGVRVLSHAETPGLGDKIETAKSDWVFTFNGLSLENTQESKWHVKKDGGQFDAFSGATITPRAVVKAIHEGLQFFQHNKHALLNLDGSDDAPIVSQNPAETGADNHE